MNHATARRFAIATLTAAALGCAANHSSLGPAEAERAFALPAHPDVPPSPDVVVERFTIVSAPAGRVYDVLADVDRWPEWDPNVSAARSHAGRPLVAGDAFFQDPAGYAVEARVLEAQPGAWLRWRGGEGIVGVHSYRLASLADGRTLVIDREEFSRWYLRPIGWVTDLGVGEQFERTLDALRARAEALPETARSH